MGVPFAWVKDHALTQTSTWRSWQYPLKSADSDSPRLAQPGFLGQPTLWPDWPSKSSFAIMGSAIKGMTGQAACPDLGRRKGQDSPGPFPRLGQQQGWQFPDRATLLPCQAESGAFGLHSCDGLECLTCFWSGSGHDPCGELLRWLL